MAAFDSGDSRNPLNLATQADSEVAKRAESPKKQGVSQSTEPQCPWCDRRLTTQTDRCPGCRGEVGWVEGKPCRPERQETLRRELRYQKARLAAFEIARPCPRCNRPFRLMDGKCLRDVLKGDQRILTSTIEPEDVEFFDVTMHRDGEYSLFYCPQCTTSLIGERQENAAQERQRQKATSQKIFLFFFLFLTGVYLFVIFFMMLRSR